MRLGLSELFEWQMFYLYWNVYPYSKELLSLQMVLWWEFTFLNETLLRNALEMYL